MPVAEVPILYTTQLDVRGAYNTVRVFLSLFLAP